MAKLSAHGFEVARISYETTLRHDDGDQTVYQVHFSYRSDGHIMRRLKAMNIHAYGPPHADYGWKLHKRLKDRKASAERIRAVAASHAEALRNSNVRDLTTKGV